jgi:hypothetical protein
MSWKNKDEEEFHRNLLKGNLIKEVVSVMLQESGYQVLPYGYETTLSGLNRTLQEWGTDQSGDTILKIRASPDLLVYVPKKPVDDEYFEMADLMLVEVKMRRNLSQTANFELYEPRRIGKIKHYRKFWGDSFLVVAIPWGNIFYVQKMKKLKVQNAYNVTVHFRKFQEVFEVKNESLEYFQKIAKQIMNIFYR